MGSIIYKETLVKESKNYIRFIGYQTVNDFLINIEAALPDHKHDWSEIYSILPTCLKTFVDEGCNPGIPTELAFDSELQKINILSIPDSEILSINNTFPDSSGNLNIVVSDSYYFNLDFTSQSNTIVYNLHNFFTDTEFLLSNIYPSPSSLLYTYNPILSIQGLTHDNNNIIFSSNLIDITYNGTSLTFDLSNFLNDLNILEQRIIDFYNNYISSSLLPFTYQKIIKPSYINFPAVNFEDSYTGGRILSSANTPSLCVNFIIPDDIEPGETIVNLRLYFFPRNSATNASGSTNTDLNLTIKTFVLNRLTATSPITPNQTIHTVTAFGLVTPGYLYHHTVFITDTPVANSVVAISLFINNIILGSNGYRKEACFISPFLTYTSSKKGSNIFPSIPF